LTVERKEKLRPWIPFAFSVLVQVFGMVWYASHLGAVVDQHSVAILRLQTDMEPRTEIEKDDQHVKDELIDIKQQQREENDKLDRLLEEKREQ
jgi:hypothetical protein